MSQLPELVPAADLDFRSGRGEYFIPKMNLIELDILSIRELENVLALAAVDYNVSINVEYDIVKDGYLVRWKPGGKQP